MKEKDQPYDGMKGYGFMEVIIFLLSIILVGAVQFLCSTMAKNALLKYLPIAVTVMGLLFCLVTYLGAFGTSSPSVVAENQYFVMSLGIPVGGAFIGCLLGILLSKLVGRK